MWLSDRVKFLNIKFFYDKIPSSFFLPNFFPLWKFFLNLNTPSELFFDQIKRRKAGGAICAYNDIWNKDGIENTD